MSPGTSRHAAGTARKGLKNPSLAHRTWHYATTTTPLMVDACEVAMLSNDGVYDLYESFYHKCIIDIVRMPESTGHVWDVHVAHPFW